MQKMYMTRQGYSYNNMRDIVYSEATKHEIDSYLELRYTIQLGKQMIR